LEASTRAIGPAPPERVWEHYTSPQRWPQWAPQIVAVEFDAPRIAAGLTGVVRGRLGVRAHFTIVEVDEPDRTWAWRVRVGPVRLWLGHGV
jgi:uncharacterized protein YndB with AHSA1/START domain